MRLLPYLALAGILHAEPDLPARDDSWKLVWSEEFDAKEGLEPAVWEHETGFKRNRELQWYQQQNVSCRDGKLIIEGRREQVSNPGFEKGHRSWRKARRFARYTSGSLITRPEHSWKFGRWEIRARFPAKAGLWPAIWSTGHGKWPGAGEIDIMEFYRGLILANTVHAGKSGEQVWNSSRTPIDEFNVETWDAEFHEWVMLWDEKRIAFYLDGRLLNEVDLTPIPKTGPGETHPFHEPHRMRLNLAIGSNGGDPSETDFPQTYEVDYVRIYQQR
jgi:beta-glucanase (GH16 family)